ncbi:MAG TPA: hypothetical protein VGO18_14110, partial [Steroidobacteraceae bacterium]|nr:hypothetical protein [Steroidobacteraceae bacterium]
TAALRDVDCVSPLFTTSSCGIAPWDQDARPASVSRPHDSCIAVALRTSGLQAAEVARARNEQPAIAGPG